MENLTLSSGFGAVAFNGLVGSFVPLNVVDATGSNSLSVVDSLLIDGFERIVDDPLPLTFNVALLLPEFIPLPETTDPNITIPPIDPFGPGTSIDDGRPARLVDASPIPRATLPLLTLASLSGIAPGAGTDTTGEESFVISEEDAEAIAQALEIFVESCPDVVLASLSWQNTPADAAFNRNPLLLPYSVDEYCAGYTVTMPGRGSAIAYHGLTFVGRDFWTDLKQSRDAGVIPEMRRAFGLPEREGN